MINLTNSKMRTFIYATVWVLFMIIVIFDISTVSSFDIMEQCVQPNLRTLNITILLTHPTTVPTFNPATYYLRHAVRI